MRYPVFALLAVLLMVSASAVGQSIGSVRFMEVVGEHPLMQTFEVSSRRFLGGVSAPHDREELARRKAGLLTEIQKLHELQEKNQEDLRKALNDKDASRVEKRFWNERSRLRAQIESLRDQVSAVSSQEEFRGQTLSYTLFPDIAVILADVQRAIQTVAARRRCSMVLTETSPWNPLQEQEKTRMGNHRLYDTTNREVFVGRMQALLAAKAKVLTALQGSVRLLRPALHGDQDLTVEVIREMKTIAKQPVVRNLRRGK